MLEKRTLTQVARVDELHQQATKYCAQLQEYNGRLQSDAQSASERLKAIQVSTSHVKISRWAAPRRPMRSRDQLRVQVTHIEAALRHGCTRQPMA